MATTPLSQAVLQGMDPNIYRPLGYMKTGDELFQQGSDSTPTSKWGAIGRLAQALSGTYLQNSATSDLARTIAGGKKKSLDDIMAAISPKAAVPSAPPAMAPAAGVAPVAAAPAASAPDKVYTNNEPSPLDPPSGDDRVRMAKTILGEAANEPAAGQNAVASVIRTRAVDGGYGGDTPSGVVTAPKQFEPWNTPEGRARMDRAYADPAQRDKAEAAITSAYGEGGKAPEDPTEGMTHFYSPTAQAALGRAAPAWAGGETVQIGGHVFNSPDDKIPANAMPTEGKQPIGAPAPPASSGIDPARLMAVLQNPYADETTKQLAQKLLLKHLTPEEDEFASGPQGIYNKRTGEVKQPASQDDFASSPQGIFNKRTGELKQGSSPDEAVYGGLSGKELLAAVQEKEPGMAARAVSILEGKSPYPTSSRINSDDNRLKKIVAQIDPTFEAGASKARMKMQTDLSSSGNSNMGGILSNGKSSFAHLADASDKMADLGNYNGPNVPGGGHVAAAGNFIGNVIAPSSETKAKQTAINDNLLKYGQESTKFYAGSGGGEAERMNAMKTLNPAYASSNEQAAYLRTEKGLMIDRLIEKEKQIRDVMGPEYLEKHPVMTPELQAHVKRIDDNVARLEGKETATKPAAETATPAATPDRAAIEAEMRKRGLLQ